MLGKSDFNRMLNESFKDGKSTVELMEECYEIGKKESGEECTTEYFMKNGIPKRD